MKYEILSNSSEEFRHFGYKYESTENQWKIVGDVPFLRFGPHFELNIPVFRSQQLPGVHE